MLVMGLNAVTSTAQNDKASSTTTTTSSLSYVSDDTKYPYFVYSAGMHVCGGTVIWEDVLLTSAHCYGMFVENGVYIGGITADGQYSHEHYTVQVEMKHPLYDPVSSENDLMLVKLHSYTQIRPIQINFNETSINDQLVSIGFGDVSTMGIQLMSIDSTIIPYSTCRQSLGVRIDNKNMLCTMSASSTTSSLMGNDSTNDNLCLDGPVIDSITGMQVAISSYGKGCDSTSTTPGNTMNPVINTRLSYYKIWIQNGICTLSSSMRKPYYCYDPTVAPTRVPNKPPMTRQPWTKYPTTAQPIKTKKPSLRPTNVPTNVPSISPTATLQSDIPSIGIRDGVKQTMVPSTLLSSDVPSMVPSISPSIILVSDMPSNSPTSINLLSDIPSMVPSSSYIQSDIPSNVPSNIPSNIATTISPTTLMPLPIKKPTKNKNKRTANQQCSALEERCRNNDDCCGDGLMECVFKQNWLIRMVWVGTKTCEVKQ
jgi:Trypsin